ncbi:hypothetical protein SAMN05428945_1541 [Streptomyces sp. 2224.1]|nr:hypothetical protein SAMN05428945_1541 [Streptomyces sp. 2224.1]
MIFPPSPCGPFTRHPGHPPEGSTPATPAASTFSAPTTAAGTAWPSTRSCCTKWRSSQPASNSTSSGLGYDSLPPETREAVVAAHPRPDFKRRILHAFHAGLAHRPQTTFGKVKADLLGRSEEGYTRPNFVRIIEDTPWPD